MQIHNEGSFEWVMWYRMWMDYRGQDVRQQDWGVAFAVNLMCCSKGQMWWVDTNDQKEGQMKKRMNGKGLLMIIWEYQRGESFLISWLKSSMVSRFRKKEETLCWVQERHPNRNVQSRGGECKVEACEGADLKSLVGLLYELTGLIIFFLFHGVPEKVMGKQLLLKNT